MEFVSAIVAVAFAYFLFSVLASSQEGRIYYYDEVPDGRFRGPIPEPDPDFRLLGFGAAIPTALLVLTTLYNSRFCSFDGDLLSIQSLFAAITVFLVGKVLNGPWAEVRKCAFRFADGRTLRPLGTKISDALLVIPGNLLRGGVWKLLALLILAILYVLGISSHAGVFAYFSMGVVIVWFFGCIGRLASIIVHRQFDWKWQPVLYISMTLACAVVWDLLETSLKGCGVNPDALPSFSSFFARVLS